MPAGSPSPVRARAARNVALRNREQNRRAFVSTSFEVLE
jgi:hypothetical protein